MPFKTKPANKNDAKTLANIHRSEINSGFLSSLHSMVLTQLYKHLSSTGTLIIATNNENEIAGFISCVTSLKKFYISFICRKGIIIAPFLLTEVFNADRFKKIIEIALLPLKNDKNSKPNHKSKATSPEELPELLSIAVSKKFQKDGIGGLLLSSLEKELTLQNIKKYRVVAGESLVGANKFYLKNGFKLSEQIEIHENEFSNIYVKEINV